MFNLESCYYRQLPKIVDIFEESIGVNKEAIKLVTKIIPKCKYCIGTMHGASADYGGPAENLGGIGKWNILSATKSLVTWSSTVSWRLNGNPYGLNIGIIPWKWMVYLCWNCVERERDLVAFACATLNDLSASAYVIQNTYLQADSSEKYYVVCAPDVGLENVRKHVIIVHALCSGEC